MYSTENAAAPLFAAYKICGAYEPEKRAAAIRNSNAMFSSNFKTAYRAELLSKANTFLTTAAPPFMWLYFPSS